MQTPRQHLPPARSNAPREAAQGGMAGAERQAGRGRRPVSLMQDIVRDWRRWSRAERIAAIVLPGLAVIAALSTIR